MASPAEMIYFCGEMVLQCLFNPDCYPMQGSMHQRQTQGSTAISDLSSSGSSFCLGSSFSKMALMYNSWSVSPALSLHLEHFEEPWGGRRPCEIKTPLPALTGLMLGPLFTLMHKELQANTYFSLHKFLAPPPPAI